MEQGILLGMLGWYAIEDVKKHSVTVSYLVLFGVLGVALQIFGQTVAIRSMGLGVAVGLGMLALSWVTRGSIGMGDGWIFCVTGIFLGGRKHYQQSVAE